MENIINYESESENNYSDQINKSNQNEGDSSYFSTDSNVLKKRKKGSNKWKFLKACSLEEATRVSSEFKSIYSENPSINHSNIIVKR